MGVACIVWVRLWWLRVKGGVPVWAVRERVVWVCPGHEYFHAMGLALSVVVGTRIHLCNGTSTLSGSGQSLCMFEKE